MAERVNHPDYYNSSSFECIDLLDRICEGYSGIAAFDIGQCKYIYRTGLKKEEGMSDVQKGIEDVSKMIFYLQDFALRAGRKNRGCSEGNLPDGFACYKTSSNLEPLLVSHAFTEGRPRNNDSQIELCQEIQMFIEQIWCLKTFEEVFEALSMLEKIKEYMRKCQSSSGD